MNLKIAIALMAVIPTVSLLSHQESKEKSVRDLREDEKIIQKGRLDLSGKSLTSLDGFDEIRGISSITQLDLSNNLLISLPSGILTRLPNLKILDISSNLLTLMPEEFCGLRQLEKLFLSSNILSKLPNINLPSLRELKLDDNNLEEFPLSLLGLAGLRYIMLCGNQSIQNEEAMLALIKYRRTWEQPCALVYRTPEEVL
jgi:Leucine-rich repeat (LRR) protein